MKYNDDSVFWITHPENGFFYFIKNNIILHERSSGNVKFAFKSGVDYDIINDLIHHKNIIFNTPRAYGKTTLLLLYSLWRMIVNPGIKITFVSASESMSKRLCAEIKDLYMRLIDKLSTNISRISMTHPLMLNIRFDDGNDMSFIRVIPCGSINHVRGSVCDILIMDEFSIFENDREVLAHSLYTQCQLIISGTDNHISLFDKLANIIYGECGVERLYNRFSLYKITNDLILKPYRVY